MFVVYEKYEQATNLTCKNTVILKGLTLKSRETISNVLCQLNMLNPSSEVSLSIEEVFSGFVSLAILFCLHLLSDSEPEFLPVHWLGNVPCGHLHQLNQVDW